MGMFWACFESGVLLRVRGFLQSVCAGSHCHPFDGVLQGVLQWRGMLQHEGPLVIKPSAQQCCPSSCMYDCVGVHMDSQAGRQAGTAV
jgi:hypothetical protein